RLHEFYLYYWIENIKTYLEKIAPRGTQANLNTTIAKNLSIFLPPISEQREIARILQTVDRKIETEGTRKEALEGLFKTLLHHLMTAKVRLPREFIERFEEN
ncbi:MAG: restriction endonuclease subunit S, partial [Methanobacteriota archaeon]